MGALRTSEEGDVVAGEGKKTAGNEDRPVEAGAKIIISAGPIAPSPPVVAPVAPRPKRPSMPIAERPHRGLPLVIALYVLSAAALAYAIYERFLAN